MLAFHAIVKHYFSYLGRRKTQLCLDGNYFQEKACKIVIFVNQCCTSNVYITFWQTSKTEKAFFTYCLFGSVDNYKVRQSLVETMGICKDKQDEN